MSSFAQGILDLNFSTTNIYAKSFQEIFENLNCLKNINYEY